MIDKKIKLDELRNILLDGRYVYGLLPNIEELLGTVFRKINNKEKIKIFYGETYDLLGITMDSIKYYFFLAQLARDLQDMGAEVEATVMVADKAATLNKSSQDRTEELEKEGKRRMEYSQRLKKYFKLPINFVLMSDFFIQNGMAKNIETVKKATDSDEEIRGLLAKTVLQNRLKQEEETGFRYGLEEIATGMEFDIKIGPPREKYYDLAAEIICQKLGVKKLGSIYLRPTYPLGQNFAFFLNHPEIEEFGLTPYKAGSNQMQNFRVIIGKTNGEEMKNLINKTYIPTDPILPNPLADLTFIAKMAGKTIEELLVELNTI